MPCTGPYQATAEKRLLGVSSDVAKGVLRKYDTMRAGLKLYSNVRLDLGIFSSTTQFGLELFRLSSRTIPVAPPLKALEEELRGGVIYTASKGGIAWTGEGVQYDFPSSSNRASSCRSACCPTASRWCARCPSKCPPGTYPKFGLYRALIIVRGIM